MKVQNLHREEVQGALLLVQVQKMKWMKSLMNLIIYFQKFIIMHKKVHVDL
jgi:hypothetical protein